MTARRASTTAGASARTELITEQQLAELWNTTTRHLRRLRADEGLPHVKVGKLVRYDLAAVNRWLDARTVEHQPGRGAA